MKKNFLKRGDFKLIKHALNRHELVKYYNEKKPFHFNILIYIM